MGISDVSVFCFNICATSNPFISGIITSSKTKSGRSFSTSSSACLPLLAVMTLNFSFVSNTFNSKTLDVTSSTISILYSDGVIFMVL
ncbi:MAG: hypothetical protein BWY47_02047 [Bacteroidetes bacterium ADurb.Bin302]|nr:MAG: hypothetical protein BWY47_02047 [Bacteroidetes bacterium ADurb.Bin302]